MRVSWYVAGTGCSGLVEEYDCFLRQISKGLFKCWPLEIFIYILMPTAMHRQRINLGIMWLLCLSVCLSRFWVVMKLEDLQKGKTTQKNVCPWLLLWLQYLRAKVDDKLSNKTVNLYLESKSLKGQLKSCMIGIFARIISIQYLASAFGFFSPSFHGDVITVKFLFCTQTTLKLLW